MDGRWMSFSVRQGAGPALFPCSAKDVRPAGIRGRTGLARVGLPPIRPWCRKIARGRLATVRVGADRESRRLNQTLALGSGARWKRQASAARTKKKPDQRPGFSRCALLFPQTSLFPGCSSQAEVTSKRPGASALAWWSDVINATLEPAETFPWLLASAAFATVRELPHGSPATDGLGIDPQNVRGRMQHVRRTSVQKAHAFEDQRQRDPCGCVRRTGNCFQCGVWTFRLVDTSPTAGAVGRPLRSRSPGPPPAMAIGNKPES
jgi:hypothetical protein